MRICLVNQYYVPDAAPTGVYLADLAEFLARSGHDVRVLCSRHSYVGGRTYQPSEAVRGVDVRRVQSTGFGRGTHIGRILDSISFRSSVHRELLRMSPPSDLIVALTTPPYLGLTVNRAARRVGAGHAHWVMDVYPDALAAHGMVKESSWLMRYLRKMARKQYSGARAVVTLSNEMSNAVSSYCDGVGVDMIPLWAPCGIGDCNSEAVRNLRKERGWDNEQVVVMYSGNMGLGHHFDTFVSAAEKMKENGKVRWVFSGGGKKLKEIRTNVDAREMKNVEFLPYMDPGRLTEHLCSADVHLVSLRSDWQRCIMPSKVQAVFGVGRPLIAVAPENGTLASWIRDSGAGWVVREADADGIVKAVQEACHAGECARRGAAALEFAGKAFDCGQACRHLADVLTRPCGVLKHSGGNSSDAA